jgi:hypothetical protein
VEQMTLDIVGPQPGVPQMSRQTSRMERLMSCGMEKLKSRTKEKDVKQEEKRSEKEHGRQKI